jgi:hypothetical protein
MAQRSKRIKIRDGDRRKQGKTTKCEICDEVMKPENFNEHVAQNHESKTSLAAGKGGRGEFYLN